MKKVPNASRPSQWASLLDTLLDAFDTPEFDAKSRTDVVTWLALVDRWRRRTDLTAARSDSELVDLMVADAACLAAHLPSGATVVDVGSGAGAPGLPIGLLRPDLRVTLVEPLQKRVAFLRTALGTLGEEVAGRISIRQVRVEHVDDCFDVAMSRATLAPDEWMAQGAQLAPKGEVWLLLAKLPLPAHPGWRAVVDQRYVWPLTGAARRVVCLRSISA